MTPSELSLIFRLLVAIPLMKVLIRIYFLLDLPFSVTLVHSLDHNTFMAKLDICYTLRFHDLEDFIMCINHYIVRRT